VPAPDRRTIDELLADSDALARDTLLDATPEIAPAMVRSWNQLVASAADLWAALSSPPDDMSKSDPMEGLRLVGEAIARSVRAGHWPGHGPTDDHLTEIADNLSRARHLIERHGRPSGPATANRQADTPDIHGQVMHTLYVAAHGTAVALGGYVTELQHRLEVGTRRRQPMAERPTTLEITEVQGMIARFSGFEQLAAARMFGQPLTFADPGQRRAAAQATRLETALAAWEVQAHRTLAANPDPADLVRIARVQALITSTTGVITEAAATWGHIDEDVMQRLGPALEAGQVASSRTGLPLHNRDFYTHIWRKLMTAVAAEHIAPFRFHDLRHTHVAWLIAGGAPLPHIQARLGHESITTTIDTYGHLLPAGDELISRIIDTALTGGTIRPVSTP
jgi:hypothetical protein